MLKPDSTIGILGGGQLGRMLALAAAQLGFKCHVFAPNPDAPAFDVVHRVTVADYTDTGALDRFAGDVDVVTYEFENVPAETAVFLAARKPGLAFTLGAMGSRQHNFYNDAFKRAGYVDAAVEVQRLWLDGKRDEAAARVPDELAVKVNLLGTEAMVRERLRVHRDAGVTTLRVDPAGSTVTAKLDTLAHLLDLVRAIE